MRDPKYLGSTPLRMRGVQRVGNLNRQVDQLIRFDRLDGGALADLPSPTA